MRRPATGWLACPFPPADGHCLVGRVAQQRGQTNAAARSAAGCPLELRRSGPLRGPAFLHARALAPRGSPSCCAWCWWAARGGGARKKCTPPPPTVLPPITPFAHAAHPSRAGLAGCGGRWGPPRGAERPADGLGWFSRPPYGGVAAPSRPPPRQPPPPQPSAAPAAAPGGSGWAGARHRHDGHPPHRLGGLPGGRPAATPPKCPPVRA